MSNSISQQRLKTLLKYNADSGVFVWLKPSKYHSEKTGMEAGCAGNSRGKEYITIRIDGIGWKAHRLAWLYVFGVMPVTIDHINGNSIDNRIENLRSVTQFENCQNHKEKIKPNGLPTGVSFTSNGKFRARIRVRNKAIALGVFDSAEAAQARYREARNVMHSAPVMGL